MSALAARCAAAGALLAKKDAWESRVEGLKILRGIFAEDISTAGMAEATQALADLRVLLRAQLEDLRSQISREACQAVSDLARRTLCEPAVWEHASDWFVAPLMTNSCATVAAIASAAVETLDDIAATGRVSRAALSSFINFCSHKHNVVRRNAFTCLLKLLHTTDAGLLLKVMPAIVKCLRTGVADAVQDTRKLARLAFWGVERLHADEALALYEGLEPSQQRSIDGERGAYGAYVAELRESQRHVIPPLDAGKRGSRPNTARAVAGRAVDHLTPREDTAALAKTTSAAHGTRAVTGTAAKSIGQGPPRVAKPSVRHVDPAAAAGPADRARAPRAADPAPLARPAPPTPGELLASIARGAASADWSARSMAFVELAQLADLGQLHGDDLAAAVSTTVEHLADTHHRVAIAATACLGRLLPLAPGAVVERCEDVLAPLLAALTSNREQQRDGATLQLSRMAEGFGADGLLQPLLRVAESTTGRQQLGAVEFLLHVVQIGRDAFSQAALMRTALTRVLAFLSRGPPPDAAKALAAVLGALYAAAPPTCVKVLQQLPAVQCRAVVQATRMHVPHLEQDLQRARLGEAPLLHPEPHITSPFRERLERASPQRPVPRTQLALTDDAAARQQHNSFFFDSIDLPPGSPTTVPGPLQHPQGTGSSSVAKILNGFSGQRYDAAANQHVDLGRQSLTRASRGPTRAEAALDTLHHPPPMVGALEQARSSEEKRAAIEQASEGIEREPKLWSVKLRPLLAHAVAFCADADHSIRVVALRWLARIYVVPYLRPLCGTELSLCMRTAYHAHNDAFPEVQREAHLLLCAVCDRTAPLYPPTDLADAALAVLHDVPEELSTRGAQALLREVGMLAPSMAAAGALPSRMRDTLATATALAEVAFASPTSDVRKSAVTILVSLYGAVGDALLPHLRNLSPAQLKLVSIYVNRQSASTGHSVDLAVEMSRHGLR